MTMATLYCEESDGLLPPYHSPSPSNTLTDIRPLLENAVGNLDEHSLYWLRATYPVLQRLLESRNYTKASSLQHILFYICNILPTFGPALVADPLWPSFMTDDHVPIELSWSWSSGNPTPKARFAVEPIPQSGDISRFVSWERAMEVATDLKHLASDRERLRQGPLLIFKESIFQQLVEIFLSKESEYTLHAPEERPSTVFFGFDLLPSQIRTKVYFVLPKTREDAAIMDALSAAFPSKAWTLLHAYLLQAKSIADPFMFAIDCSEVANTRMKVYVRYSVDNLDHLLTHLSLGGAAHLSPQFLAGVKRAWELSIESRSITRFPPFLLYYDFMDASSTPGMKLYVPMHHLGSNDLEVAGILQDWFLGERGFCEAGNQFVHTMEGMCHTRPLSAGKGFFTYFGIAQKGESKVEAFVYLKPDVRGLSLPPLHNLDIPGVVGVEDKKLASTKDVC